MQVELTICGISDIVCKIFVDRSHSILHVKKQILQVNGVPVQDQRLFHNDQELKNLTVLTSLRSDSQTQASELQLQFIRRPLGQAEWLRNARLSARALENAPDTIRDDPEVAMIAVEQYPLALRYMSEDIRSDPAIILAALRLWSSRPSHHADHTLDFNPLTNKWMSPVDFASEHLRGDFEFMRDVLIEYGSWHMSAATADLWSNKLFAMIAIQADGSLLKHASRELKVDREVVANALKSYPHSFEHAARELKRDRDFLLLVLPHCRTALAYAGRVLRGDREVVMSAVQQNGRALAFASVELQGDRDVVISAIQQDGRALEFASVELQGNRHVVISAVQQDGSALEFASRDLQADRDIFACVPDCCLAAAFKRADTSLKNDRSFVLQILSRCGMALYGANEELKGDMEVVLAAVRQDARALFDASVQLRDDPAMIAIAMRQSGVRLQSWSRSTGQAYADPVVAHALVTSHGENLQFVSSEMQADRQIVLQAVKRNGVAIKFASDLLKADREIALQAVRCDVAAFQYIAQELQIDRDIALVALRSSKVMTRRENELWSVVEGFKKNPRDHDVQVFNEVKREHELSSILNSHIVASFDRELVLLAVRLHGECLQFVSEVLKEDREIAFAAVQQSGRALAFTAAALRADRMVCAEAVKCDGSALKHVAQELKSDRLLVLLALANYPRALEFAAPELQADRDVVFSAVMNDRSSHAKKQIRENANGLELRDAPALRYVSEAFRSDRQIVLAAVTANWEALRVASHAMQAEYDIVMAAVSKGGYAAVAFAAPDLRKDAEILAAARRCAQSSLEHRPRKIRRVALG